MVLILIDPGDSDLNSMFSADGYRCSVDCTISSMVRYGGQSIDCCYKFATDTKRKYSCASAANPGKF